MRKKRAIITFAALTAACSMLTSAVLFEAPSSNSLIHAADAASPAAAPSKAASIYIAPINNAKLLAGEKFDFRVELNDLKATPSKVSITVNGKAADTFFGKSLVKSSSSATSQEFMIRDVSILTAGTYEVKVVADNLVKSVKYNVVLADTKGTKAKNVILIVGDGMGHPVVTATRAVSKGMTEGKYNGLLEMDKLEQRAVVSTSSMNAIMTDSANTASAYTTGQKAVINALGTYPDNNTNSLDDPKVETIGEIMKRVGKSVGIVSTSEVQDATPASIVAHTNKRDDKADIAEMLYKVQPEVVLGGGSAYFLPKSVTGSKRKDEKDIYAMFEQSGYNVVDNATQLKSIDASKTNKLLGLFHPSNMSVYYDRSTKNAEELKTFTDQPNLWDMTQKAIDVLKKDKDGFFLMVEGSSIDKMLHPYDPERAIYDAIEMDKAVGVARQFAEQDGETLVIVTADHAHSMSLVGTYWEGDGKSGINAIRQYQDAGFPTYTDANKDGFPDNPNPDRKLVMMFAAATDYYEDFKIDKLPTAPAVQGADGKLVPNASKLANPDDPDKDRFLVKGNFQTTSGPHSIEDVPLMAGGPGSAYFKGTMDNTDVFFGMINAMGVNLVGGKTGTAALSWAPLKDFVTMMSGQLSVDRRTKEVVVSLNGNVIKINTSTGKAVKNGKTLKVDVKVANGKTLVSTNSLTEVILGG